MGCEDQMGAEGMNYWRQLAINIAVLAAWFLVAWLLQLATGYDGFRLSGYVIMAIGIGLAAWKWRTKDRNPAFFGACVILGFGALVSFHR